jgi:hypothetical protein
MTERKHGAYSQYEEQQEQIFVVKKKWEGLWMGANGRGDEGEGGGGVEGRRMSNQR